MKENQEQMFEPLVNDRSPLKNLWQSRRFQLVMECRKNIILHNGLQIQINICVTHWPIMLILPLNMEYRKGPTEVINKLSLSFQANWYTSYCLCQAACLIFKFLLALIRPI